MPNGVSTYGTSFVVTNEQALIDREFQLRQLRRENAELRAIVSDQDCVLQVSLRYLRCALGMQDEWLWDENAKEWLENLEEHQEGGRNHGQATD